MENEYKIEVIVSPHIWDNPKKPYSWCVFKWCKDAWCNAGFGWEETPEQAWREAINYHNRFHKGVV